MKYLIKNKKEFIATVVAIIVGIANILKGFGIVDFDVNAESITAVVTVIVGGIIWYFNMPTRKENCEHTGAMRLEKEQAKGIITGEDFTDEAEEIEEKQLWDL